MVLNLLEGKHRWYLSSGRSLYHYNNGAQTKESPKLIDRKSEDVLLVNKIHQDEIGEFVKLKSKYGESGVLKVKFVDSVKPFTLYTTFHFVESGINYLFGSEGDEKVKTTRFKSVEVEIEKD